MNLTLHPEQARSGGFHISLRTLLAIITFTACCLALLGRIVAHQRSVHAAIEQLVQRGAIVETAPWLLLGRWQCRFYLRPRAVTFPDVDAADEDAYLVARLQSIEELHMHGAALTDACMTQIALLKNLTSLDVRSEQMTDNGLANLSSLTRLRYLIVETEAVDGSFVDSLSSCAELWELRLTNTSVNDAAVARIALTFPRLGRLGLVSTRVTDNCIASLCELFQLSEVDLRYTDVTDEGVNRLQSRAPSLTILY